MQLNLLWTGRAYYSLENCLVNVTDSGSETTSVIVGRFEEHIYRVEYRVKTNTDWETVFFEVKSQHNNQTQVLLFEGDGKGNWTSNAKRMSRLDGCIDIDIPLTPFTNSLPIRRLKLRPNQTEEIQVLYCDLLAQNIKPVRQSYTCLSDTRYHYQNIPNDFEATIEVDEWGLVVDYSSLFVRTAVVRSEYRENLFSDLIN